MLASVTCHYMTYITMVYMRSHNKCFQERELMHLCYLKFGSTSQDKLICAVEFGIRHLQNISVGFELKTFFPISPLFSLPCLQYS